MKKLFPVIIGLVFIAGLVTVSCLIDKTPRLKQEETIPNEPNPDLADLTLDTYEIGINEVVDVMVSEEIFKVKLLNMYEEDIVCPKEETCPFAYEIKIAIEINDQIYNVNYNDNPSLKFGNTNNFLRFDRCYLGDKICFVVVPLIKGESYLVDNFVNRKLPVFEKKGVHYEEKVNQYIPGHYYYIASGTQTGGGHYIKITDVEIIDKVVNVKVKEIAPRPGDVVNAVMFSYPVCLLILDEKMDIIVKNQNDEVLENLNF